MDHRPFLLNTSVHHARGRRGVQRIHTFQGSDVVRSIQCASSVSAKRVMLRIGWRASLGSLLVSLQADFEAGVRSSGLRGRTTFTVLKRLAAHYTRGDRAMRPLRNPGICALQRLSPHRLSAPCAGLFWWVVAALVVTNPSAAATRYVFAAFKGDSAENEKLSIYTSSDGLNFTLLSNTGYSGPTGVLRDPSLMKHSDGQYYVAYTVYSWDTESTSFAIAKSPDLAKWTFLVSVPAQVSGARHTWAPEWFKDSDGSTHLIVSVDSPEWDFKPYLYTATNDTLTQWSAPQPLGFGPNYIDTFIVTVGNTYHAFVKNETTKYIEHATASALRGPWTFVGTGDWAGWGSGKEGPALFRLDNGSWRMFLDCYSGCGYLHTTSTDLMTWSATSTVPGGLSGTVRHGTVLREETGSGGASSTGGASSAGGATATTSGGQSNLGGASAAGGSGTRSSGGAGTFAGSATVGGNESTGGTGGSGGTRTTALATGGEVALGGSNSGGARSTGGRSSLSSSAPSQGGAAVSGGNASSGAAGNTSAGMSTASTGGMRDTGGMTSTGGSSGHTATATAGTKSGGSHAVAVGGASTSVVNSAAAASDAGNGCGGSLPGSSARPSWLLAAVSVLACIRRRRAARVRAIRGQETHSPG